MVPKVHKGLKHEVFPSLVVRVGCQKEWARGNCTHIFQSPLPPPVFYLPSTALSYHIFAIYFFSSSSPEGKKKFLFSFLFLIKLKVRHKHQSKKSLQECCGMLWNVECVKRGSFSSPPLPSEVHQRYSFKVGISRAIFQCHVRWVYTTKLGTVRRYSLQKRRNGDFSQNY